MLLCLLNSTDASWLGKLLPNEATTWWSPSAPLLAAVESSVRTELKFSYQLHAVQPCLCSRFGLNEFGDRQLMVVELFKMEWFLRLQEE